MSEPSGLIRGIVAVDREARKQERARVLALIRDYQAEIVTHGNVPADPFEAKHQACHELIAAIEQPS